MVSPVNAFNTALSGLNAASKRVAVSAANIANQHSTKTVTDGVTTNQPYTPKRVENVSLENGGVQAKVEDVQPATVPLYDPGNPDAVNDIVQTPNVSIEKELVDQIIAAAAYKANIKTIQVENDLTKSLLDIKS